MNNNQKSIKAYIIIIAGIPASGKTTYARHIANQLHIPFIGKDAIKEKLYDVVKYDTSKRENSQLYGAASYSVFFQIAECLMEADISFVLESNFTPASADILLPLVEKYNYRALTILFDADMNVLHKRFCERDITDERHPGLASKSDVFNDFDTFNKATLPLRDFGVGKKIIIDTTDFSTINYKEIDVLVKNFIKNNMFDITIRLAVPADAPDMAEVVMRSWEVAYKDIIPADYIKEKNAARPKQIKIDDDNTIKYVIQKDGKTIGIMTVAPSYDDDLDDSFYDLQVIYLHPDYYRQGIGSQAMEFAYDIARGLGKTVMTVWLLADNHNAKKFYEKCGFIADGKTKTKDYGKTLTLIRMRKEL